MRVLQNIRLIIFDLDGTIVHTRPDLSAAFQKTSKAMDLKPISLEDAGGYVGAGAKEALKILLGSEHIHLFDKALGFFRATYSKHCADNSTLYPNVREVLQYFNKKAKIALATSKIRSATLNILREFGILPYFDLIVTADDIQFMKPHPQCIEIVLHKLGVVPHEAVVVGDMRTDIQAGKAAGVHTIAVTCGYGNSEDLRNEKPEFTIDSFIALKNIILPSQLYN